MVLTPQQLEAMMPDGKQLLSDEPEMESSLEDIWKVAKGTGIQERLSGV